MQQATVRCGALVGLIFLCGQLGLAWAQEPAPTEPMPSALGMLPVQPLRLPDERSPTAPKEEIFPNIRLIIAGSILQSLAWVPPAVAVAYFGTKTGATGNVTDYSATWPLALPIVGPWVQMAKVNTHDLYAGFSYGIYAVDGLLQVTGVALLIAGATARTTVIRYAGNGIVVSPLFAQGGSGAVVMGRF